jgi:transcriptional regulator with XRE-family HTH domain
MVNHRLRAAITASGLSYDELGEELDVSSKTVERWITKSRVPYPRHRHGLTERLGKPEKFFWPELFEEPAEKPGNLGSDDIVAIYPQRSSVPDRLWKTLLVKASERIDLLVYAGEFLFDAVPDLTMVLAEKEASGTRIRIALGDPRCAAVAERGREEGVADRLSATITAIADRYWPLLGRPGVSVRFHKTTLYTSICQFDDEMIVTNHVYGLSGARAPTIHLRRCSSGQLFATYIMSFERVWQNAT